MLAQQLVREGKLSEALAALQDAIRKNASDARLRVFLFQLLAVMGQWSRALNQLNVAGELDAATLPMVQTYRAAIQCEALRADIFAGTRAPLIFGEPQPWLVQLLEALKVDEADPARAAAAREQALESAPASSGSIEGTPFDWLADADMRLGPVLEAIVNGRYFWIPLCRIARIEFDPPADLRDTVWSAATFTWTNGASTVGLIPARYPGTVASMDDSLLLARRTEWRGNEVLGQRMFVSDEGEYSLLEARTIAFDVALDEVLDEVVDEVVDNAPDEAGQHG
jgi:type VI secretion system protein ImpE